MADTAAQLGRMLARVHLDEDGVRRELRIRFPRDPNAVTTGIDAWRLANRPGLEPLTRRDLT